MKNTGKNRSEAESYSASETAAWLGVSIPTLKRMAAEGRLESFRTPGGHLRILAESIEAVREQRPIRSRPVREASPVLQNRRERLEELTIEAQEMRAKRELAQLRRHEQEETERREPLPTVVCGILNPKPIKLGIHRPDGGHETNLADATAALEFALTALGSGLR